MICFFKDFLNVAWACLPSQGLAPTPCLGQKQALPLKPAQDPGKRKRR